MIKRPMLAKAAFILLVFFGMTVVSRGACVGPAPLEARVHAHPDAKVYAELGSWFGKQHNYDCATEALQSALKFDPRWPDLYYLLGLSLYSSGHVEDAVAPLQQSIRLDANALKPHLILAAVFNQLKRNPDADVQWKEALRIDPRSLEALDGLSKSLIAEQEYTSAIGVLQSAPHDETLTLDMAFAYSKAGKLDESAQILTRALHANPSSVRLVHALATVLFQQARYQDAAQLSGEAVRLHPRNTDAQRLYFRVLVATHDSALATPLGRKLLSVAPHDPELLRLNGILEREAGQYTAARDHLKEAAATDPTNADCHYNLGVVLLQLKDFQGAKEHLGKALDLGDAEPQVRYELAAALRALGETQQAQEQ